MNAKKSISLTTLILAGALTFAPATFGGEVGCRQARQQARIGQGVASGQLTARETARLETKEAALQREKVSMRQLNGGTLTAGEKVLLNRQENKLSHRIYAQKHD